MIRGSRTACAAIGAHDFRRGGGRSLIAGSFRHSGRELLTPLAAPICGAPLHRQSWALREPEGRRLTPRRWQASVAGSAGEDCTAESEWRLYAALEKRDEASHVALARFVAEFRELHEEASRGSGGVGGRPMPGVGDAGVEGGSSPRVEPAAFGDKAAAEGDETSVDGAKRHVLSVQGCSRSFRLGEQVTPATAAETLARCAEGAILAAADLQRLLKQATKVLLAEPAVARIPSPKEEGESVVVVGDLHGSISDLAEVIRRCGPPGPTTYIFNGDFVDRGRHGVEVVIVLCALKLAHPQRIYLNRGNHECKNLSRVYGLEREIKSKYRGKVAGAIFNLLASLFSALPWAVVVGGSSPSDAVAALVLHGGIPSRIAGPRGLKDLESLGAMGRGEARLEHVVRSKQQKEEYPGEDPEDDARLLEELVWSDPDRASHKDTVMPNSLRKAGNYFALGAIRRYLEREGLRTLVRSHEVVRTGLERVECGPGFEMYTVFSSSNYPDKRGHNLAAALRFTSSGSPRTVSSEPHSSGAFPPDLIHSSLWDSAAVAEVSGEGGFGAAEVIRWQTDADAEPAIALDTTTNLARARTSVQTLGGLIARQRCIILDACERAEKEEKATLAGGSDADAVGPKDGFLSLNAWSRAMAAWSSAEGVSLPSVDWQALLPLLAAGVGGAAFLAEAAGFVDYRRLFDSYNLEIVSKSGQPLRGGALSERDIMGLYSHHAELGAIFAWMDADNSGSLSLEEVKVACEKLNERSAGRGGGCAIDAEALFRAMDFDDSGSLDLHEFMECFRLAGDGCGLAAAVASAGSTDAATAGRGAGST